MDPKAETPEEINTSDNDSGERPVRKKLKETSITSAPPSFAEDHLIDPSANNEREGADSRPRSRGRKRSFDETQPEEEKGQNSEGRDVSSPRRKRSRDSNTENGGPTSPIEIEKRGDPNTPPKQPSGDAASREIMSPKKKRSRDQLDKDELQGKAAAKSMEEKVSAESLRDKGERDVKRHRDDSQERDSDSKGPIKSAFSNTSTVSPFGSLASSTPSTSKEEESPKKAPSTSASAFASSSLAAFAGSEQSPFGSLGSSTTSVFKSASASQPGKPASTGFAAASGPSPFAAAATSGFGGSGFSSFSNAFPKTILTGGLTSFASPGGPEILGTSKPKPLGATSDDEEEEEEVEESKPKEFEKEMPDERFQEQHIETGEENEKTYFSCKGKLFQFTEKKWKERGIGTFKINVKEPAEGKKTARMIMRADGVLRVMLNSPVFKGMAAGDIEGKEPKNKQINLASVEEGRSVPYLLRTGNEEVAKQLYHTLCRLQEEL